jgi:hypothetical protein
LGAVDDANDLLEQLTYLPLAIVQAASFIDKNDIRLRDYISLLGNQEKRAIELLIRDFEDDGRYQDVKNPVATTWIISFEQIRKNDSLASDYLTFMACIDAKDIPLTLLPPGPSPLERTVAMGTLKAYSLSPNRLQDYLLISTGLCI